MIPDQTLNQLEREPIVHFGCTYSEIKNCAMRAGLFGFLPGFILGSLLHFSLAVILAFLFWTILSAVFMKKIAKTRADKPIFYENHLKHKKNSRFIRSNLSYQRERNIR